MKEYDQILTTANVLYQAVTDIIYRLECDCNESRELSESYGEILEDVTKVSGLATLLLVDVSKAIK